MKNIVFIVLINFAVSCIGSASYNKKLVSNYRLSAIDVITGMTIDVEIRGYYVGVISPCVYAVGFNDEFIIAKQHPLVNNQINKSVTNYFIIPIKNKVSRFEDLNKIGPLNKEEFNATRIEIGIPTNLNFSIIFNKLK